MRCLPLAHLTLLVIALGCRVVHTNPIEFGFTAPAIELSAPVFRPEEGKTPAFVVIEKVVTYSTDDTEDSIVLRNMGGQTLDLAGWQLVDASGSKPYLFGEDLDCEEYSYIPPARKLVITKETEDNPCGFPFEMPNGGEVNLINPKGELVANVGWDQSYKGLVIQRAPDGEFKVLNERYNLYTKLETLGNFNHFLRALNVTGLSAKLKGQADPEYDHSQYHIPQVGPEIIPQFPSYFGYTFNRSEPLPPPTAPKRPAPEEGIPEMGPYTVFAPTDKAFEDLQYQLARLGEEPVPLEFIFEMPELRDMMLYHIAPGLWTSDLLMNNSAISTSKVAELVPFVDGIMGEGKILLHDACLDKATPDGISCETQKGYGKCLDPFMISPLTSNWIGGFCERTCGRCSCDVALGAVCSAVVWPDIISSNGVIHGIDRVLFAPPVFEPVDVEEIGSDARVVEKSTTKRSSKSKKKDAKPVEGEDSKTPSGSQGTTG